MPALVIWLIADRLKARGPILAVLVSLVFPGVVAVLECLEGAGEPGQPLNPFAALGPADLAATLLIAFLVWRIAYRRVAIPDPAASVSVST